MAKLNLGINEEKFYQLVYKEFGKTRQDVEEYVDIIQKWAEDQPHFPEIPSRNTIINGIVTSKFSIERLKERIDMYYTIRKLMPEIFATHPLSPEIEQHNKVVIHVPLPKPTSNHQRVIYSYMNPEYGPEDFVHERYFIQITQLTEVFIQQDKCYNFQIVCDCAGIKLGHLLKFSPIVSRKLAICIEKVYSARVSCIYIVNFYPYLENFFNKMVKPLLPEKIRDRVKVFEGTEQLFDYIDKSILPKDIGGEEMSLEELRVLTHEKYEEMKPRFDKIQYMVVDESLRPAKLENDDILGYYGSFKQIAFD